METFDINEFFRLVQQAEEEGRLSRQDLRSFNRIGRGLIAMYGCIGDNAMVRRIRMYLNRFEPNGQKKTAGTRPLLTPEEHATELGKRALL